MKNEKRYQVRVSRVFNSGFPPVDHLAALYDIRSYTILYTWWENKGECFGMPERTMYSNDFPFIHKKFDTLNEFQAWFTGKYFVELI